MPATKEQLAYHLGEKFLWDNGVKSLIEWQFGLHGDFKAALWNAISVADAQNLSRLYDAFPEEIAAFRQWIDGDLGTRLREAGLEI